MTKRISFSALILIVVLVIGCKTNTKLSGNEGNRQDNKKLTCFDISREKYEGVDVFKLDGGMSAEYVVEKAAENLTSGISQSWYVNAPGSGPNHVYATPEFLEKSVNYTVDFYNQAFGRDKKLETVIIAPGIPSIPYISNALKAPVLPLHFLVSTNSVKAIQAILKYSDENNCPSYATLSHDPSVPYAVSWIKLLDMPEAYKNFIKQHDVKNVIILGSTGVSTGETKAKRLLDGNSSDAEYADQSIYIMYPGTSPDDVITLNQKIEDLKDFNQADEFIRVADWESGINPKQLTNLGNSSKDINSVKAVITVTAEDLGKLYNMGTYCTVALMSKNKQMFGEIKGVVFNPYLISHPVIEAQMGYVPLLYWQLVGANYTVHNFEHNALTAIKHFFPETKAKNLKLWLNSTRNFGGAWSADNLKKELVSNGFSNFTENNYTVDEVWNLSDGVNAPCELLFQEIKHGIGFKELKKWNDSIQPLTITDIKELTQLIGEINVTIR